MRKKPKVRWKGKDFWVIRGHLSRTPELKQMKLWHALRRNGAVRLPGNRWGHPKLHMATTLQKLVRQRVPPHKRWCRTHRTFDEHKDVSKKT